MLRFHHAMALTFLLLAACARAPDPAQPVVHEEMALAKAHKAWASVFSKTAAEPFSSATIRRFEPYSVTLENGIWVVRPHLPDDFHGEAPEARVAQADGTVSVSSVRR